MDNRRVVVTGVGAITPLGLDVEQTWGSLIAGRSGVTTITAFDAAKSPVRIAAEVTGFDAVAAFGRRRARHIDRVVQLALVATKEAIEASKLDVASVPERIGVVYATGIGGIRTLEDGIRVLIDRGAEWVNPYVVPMMIPNMAAGEIAMEWQLLGYNCCTVTACSASAHAIGTAYDAIRLGRADAVVTGGSEAAVTPVGIAGFAAMKALSTRNDEPERASRPFDRDRDGFVLGEAAATLVLEEREFALRRGAPVLAELVGYGATSDAYHITQPHPGGDGAVRAMLAAIADSGLSPAEIDYVNAHGTSTPPNDVVETRALKRVFGPEVPLVSSTKSMTGHTLGAAGALESVFCILALQTSTVPPTINLDNPDPACDLDYVANVARPAEIRYALTNSLGFGGHNAALVFGQVAAEQDQKAGSAE
ncbi:MAG TPA: beta-ketoacyl-ACP synthase II [Acidimicrobiales bacterium]|nr:beta-ketoacyl-ACP synthase II [Acidimicrobiales bacterium]